jgi:cysteinyl-tRNA synthetase
MMNTAPDNGEGNSFLARLEQTRQEFRTVMDDDFNTPKALAVLQDLTREVNSLLNSEVKIGLSVLKAIHDTYTDLGGTTLGVIPTVESTAGGNHERESGLIELLIDMRARARAGKNYAESDRIRNELSRLGVILEDRPDGTIWKLT